MASVLHLVIISISLAADALSVSIAGGMKSQQYKTQHALKVAGFFGAFQAGMPIIGWMIGAVITNLAAGFSPLIAFVLLTIVGLKMIKESLSADETNTKNIHANQTLFTLAVATSIDALVVGVTLEMLHLPIVLSAIVIGLVTFVLCFIGYILGRHLGNVFGKQVEIVGGVAIIAVGIKILIPNI